MEPDNAPYSKLKTTGVGGWVDTFFFFLKSNKKLVFSFSCLLSVCSSASHASLSDADIIFFLEASIPSNIAAELWSSVVWGKWHAFFKVVKKMWAVMHFEQVVQFNSLCRKAHGNDLLRSLQTVQWELWCSFSVTVLGLVPPQLVSEWAAK